MSEPNSELAALARRRWRMGLGLTLAMVVVYFGFVLVVAFNKQVLGVQVVPGLSVGILAGALIILFAWGLTGYYVRWANRHYDGALEKLHGRR